ncbi:MAG TPA: hypothetical protein DHV36_00360 [Desulfobacteraceae bacterium]|nr:hypothetical protein [Desulfobacteraceae bacterium]|tara:strand:+ start:465 stop:2084 length:1620 start_codon:yes stop_codon:yes gene_type:complete
MRTTPEIEKLKRQIKSIKHSEVIAENKSIRFQKFLDAFPFGIYIVNEKFEIEYINALLQREFGNSDGQKCYQYFHDLQSPCSWCKNEKVFNGESVIWNWHSEKTQRDYELFDLPIKNDDGSISKIEIFNDITDRLRLASELERFKLAVEQSADGIMMTNLEGEITYTNSAAEQIYGYDSGELISLFVETLSVDEQAAEDFIVSRIKKSGRWQGELEQKQKDQSRFTAYLSCTIVREADKPVALLIIIRDITGLKLLEQKQLRTRNLLESVYESLDQAVFVVDPQDRKILSCNSASEKIFGYAKNEMIGKNTEFLHSSKEAYRQYGKKVSRAVTSGTEFHVEFNLKNKQGKVFPTGHIVKSVGKVPGLPPIHVTVIKDLTFRKLAEEKLAHQQEELKNRAQRLEELNAALKVLLDQREKEKRDLETGLTERLNGLILPTINKLRKQASNDIQEDLLNILEANIREITKPVNQNVTNEMMVLSPTENTIADLIKLGYRTKEIAGKMSISSRTVEFHRDNIRKKLKIKGRKVNLKTYLSRIS